jgi:hypothetical protein
VLSPAEEFAKNGYAVIRSAIQDDRRQFLLHYVSTVSGRFAVGDPQVPGTPSEYGDFATEGLLKIVQPAIENRIGLALFPTYSYLRIYKHGDSLERHVDRSACEISASLCLGYTPDEPWPIWVEHLGNAAPISLLAGDMLIYRGIDVKHWRETYTGERLAQVFLHYVDQTGPHRDWKFDKRPGLGTPRQQIAPDRDR